MAVELPATGDLLIQVPRCTPADVGAAARAARAAQPGWARTPVTGRSRGLARVAGPLLARQAGAGPYTHLRAPET